MGERLDFGEIENVLEQIAGKNIGFEALLNNAMTGESLFSVGKWMELLGNVILTTEKS